MSKDNRVVYSYRKFEVPPNVNRSCPNGGVARVAFRVERPAKDYSGKEYEYTVSFAFCSPLDNFNRLEARALTTARAYFTTGFINYFTNIINPNERLRIIEIINDIISEAECINDARADNFVRVIKSSDRLRIAEIVDDTINRMIDGEINCPYWMRDAVELGLDED